MYGQTKQSATETGAYPNPDRTEGNIANVYALCPNAAGDYIFRYQRMHASKWELSTRMQQLLRELQLLLFSDINECTPPNGNCQQGCSNYYGNYSCYCFQISTNARLQMGTVNKDAAIITGTTVATVTLDTEGGQPIITHVLVRLPNRPTNNVYSIVQCFVIVKVIP